MHLCRNFNSVAVGMVRIISGKKYLVLCLLIVSGIFFVYHGFPLIKDTVNKNRNCYTYYYYVMPNMTDEIERLYRSKPQNVTSRLHVFDSAECIRKGTLDSSIILGTIKTLAGPVNIYTYGNKDIYISRNILKYHDWEGGYRQAIERLLMAEKSLNFIDFGTNIGAFALTAAKHNRQVVAVDANSRNLELLAHSLAMNKNFTRLVTLVHNALSNEYGKVILNLNPWNIGGSGVAKVGTNNHVRQTIDAIPADDLIPIVPFKRAVLKMDIEAFEHMAMAGASRLFEKIDIPYVLMEWSNQMEQLHKIKRYPGVAFLYRFFKDRGYVPYNPTINVRLPDYFCLWSNDVFFKRKRPHQR